MTMDTDRMQGDVHVLFRPNVSGWMLSETITLDAKVCVCMTSWTFDCRAVMYHSSFMDSSKDLHLLIRVYIHSQAIVFVV